jgi:hypothetical protein
MAEKAKGAAVAAVVVNDRRLQPAQDGRTGWLECAQWIKSAKISMDKRSRIVPTRRKACAPIKLNYNCSQHAVCVIVLMLL